MSEVRVRFAPSPTGYLHIGGARTALFNWLFARHHGGDFVLRIEDTDLERSTSEAVEAMIEDLRWLGLQWDEGPSSGGDYAPYFQSERLSAYQRIAADLMDSDLVYPCYCSQAELNERRQAARSRGETFQYDGRCRHLHSRDREAFEAEGREPVLRFKAPVEGTTMVDDRIHGRISFSHTDIGDYIVMKSNGVPTYNFACVVDDHQMKISHVIRGDDHLSNTPRQILLYKALNWDLPEFAHVPLILGGDGQRLSKRHGATAVETYRRDGFLPEALVNYLSLLGWSPGNDEEILPVEELTRRFDLDNVSKTAAVFDRDKLEWMNGKYIRQLDGARFFELATERLVDEGLIPPLRELGSGERERIHGILSSVKDRIRVFSDLPEDTRYFFEAPQTYDEAGVEKHFNPKGTADVLRATASRLAEVEPWEREAIEQSLRSLIDELDIGSRQLIHPVRLALSGRTFTPGIFLTIQLIGRKPAIDRLKQAAQRIEKDEVTAVQNRS